MTDDAVPDMTTSFLDLLLSALGGVALLVMLFAASQSIDQQRKARLPDKLLYIEVEDHGPETFQLGDTLSCLIIDSDGQVSRLNEPEPFGGSAGDLRVRWREAPKANTKTHCRVEVDPSRSLTLRVWLANLESERGKPLVPARLDKAIKVKAWWASDEGSKVTLVLKRDNRWYAEAKLPSEAL